MEKKRLVMVLVASLLLAVGWTYARIMLQQRHPEWFAEPPPQQQTATQTNPQQGGGDSGGGAAGVATPTATQAVTQQQATAPATAPGGVQVVGGESRPALLGNPAFDPKGTSGHPIALSIDPRGASI